MKRPRDFQRCYRFGRVRSHRYVVLHVADAPDGVTRVGFSVSKKIGNAVARNRVKRWLREGMRAYARSIKPGVHLVVSARVPARDAGFTALHDALGRVLKQAGVLLPADVSVGEGAD